MNSKWKNIRLALLATILAIICIAALVPYQTWLLAWQVRFGDPQTVCQAIGDAYQYREQNPIVWWAIAPAAHHQDPDVRFLALAIRHELAPSDISVRDAFVAGMLSSNPAVRCAARHPPKGLIENDVAIPYYGDLLFLATNLRERVGAVIELREMAESDDRAYQILRKASVDLQSNKVVSVVNYSLKELDKRRANKPSEATPRTGAPQ